MNDYILIQFRREYSKYIAEAIRKKRKFSQVRYDGDAMVSTGVDSRDGNTVGDDRKSSK